MNFFLILSNFLILLFPSQRLAIEETFSPLFPLEVESIESNSSNFGGKVIIIGSGTAGLFAGYTLSYLGVPFEILEARSTFGGRVQRIDDFIDVPLDIGAEWISKPPRMLQDLLLYDDEANPELIRWAPDTTKIWPYFEPVNSFFYSLVFDIFDFFGQSIYEHKFKNSTWSQYLEDFIVPYVQEYSHYNTVVSQIDYSSNQVEVTTTDGTKFLADKVIVAVPALILQSEDISFVPDLSDERKSAISRFEILGGLKVFLEFRTNFYADVTLNVSRVEFLLEDLLGDGQLVYNAAFGKDQTSRNVMVFYVLGEASESLVNLDESDMIQEVLKRVDKMYDDKATENLIKYKIQNWSKEPFIRSGYVNEQGEDVLANPIDDKVYFAGEYLSRFFGYVHGAAVSGRDAAIAVAEI